MPWKLFVLTLTKHRIAQYLDGDSSGEVIAEDLKDCRVQDVLQKVMNHQWDVEVNLVRKSLSAAFPDIDGGL